MASAYNLDVEAFYTGLLFDLFVSVLNIDFSHRHVGIQRSGLESFVLSYAKRALVSEPHSGYADRSLCRFDIENRIQKQTAHHTY